MTATPAMTTPATATPTPAAQRAWDVLDSVTDPEIPVVTIRELGILREINELDGGALQVVITPTYSGCPAMGQIEDDVRAALASHGVAATVVTRLAPAWTTDWISAEARAKLRAYGIAPPHTMAATTATTTTAARTGRQAAAESGAKVLAFAPRRPGGGRADAVACPRCGSVNTTETSHFGSTACKSLHKCLDCLEPFDHFKPY